MHENSIDSSNICPLLNIFTAPDVQDVIVRNLQLNGYTFNKHDRTFTVKFTWNAPKFAVYKTVDHYEIAFHLIGPYAHHVHCPSFGNRQSCPAVVTNLTSYLIPKVAPSQYTIIAVKPVFKNSFAGGFSKAISIEPLEFTCQGKRPGIYEDPLDCTAYYHCGHHGQINHFHCQAGLYWNSTILACDWMRNGKCKHHIVLFSCQDKPNGYYPDPESCQSFYQCYEHHAYWESCPGELYWNQNTNKCDWPNNVDCEGDELHKTTDSEIS
ncbi:Chondroitin proteoglycan-2 [Exaiptasia diaphana]|nr:Chondroitin proteoglycan-2 [Exaiptasia diaphana]